ncbi:hypothetical protein Hamer_G007068 [Homarus americanus]|uniref:Uncharacterized protein n=1 Tax=Homarus americanus TaxID=6706 RepID=A0A8J5N3Y5_HOMAM|nr:hypothetical protein Hamer_G007068 [Homarus americanus]
MVITRSLLLPRHTLNAFPHKIMLRHHPANPLTHHLPQQLALLHQLENVLSSPKLTSIHFRTTGCYSSPTPAVQRYLVHK